jgi:hypothetical protein
MIITKLITPSLNPVGLAVVMSILASLILCCPVNAAPRLAILNFELKDLTSLPNTPAELARTASIKPLLEQAIKGIGDYEIIQIKTEAQDAANAGFGYLFNFNDVVATLGKKAGADWIVVGQHSKPSFLFSYLMAHLIHIRTQSLAGSYAIELKGNHEKVTQRGVNSLAKKLNASMNR